MTTRIFSLFAALMALSACDSSTIPDGESTGRQAALRSSSTASKPGLIMYASLSDTDLWSYVESSGNRVDVGLKAPEMDTGVRDGKIIVSALVRIAAKAAVLAVPGVELIYEDELLPQIGLNISNAAALSALRSLPFVDYVEPASILPLEGEESIWMNGCGYDGYDKAPPYISSSGDNLSPRIGRDIEAAWAYSQGAGITISFVGTGVSQTQPQLNEDFATGYSAGRTITKDYQAASPSTNPWHDDCGHETKLIGNAAAPRDGLGLAGIAYRANVYSVRTDNDVVLSNDSYDVQLGIRKAVLNGRIVNMAFGANDYKTNIAYEIDYWHSNGVRGEDRIFVGAAGTSKSYTNHFVAFPASMYQVVAVTGTDPDDGACDGRCHYDQAVEFGMPESEPSVGVGGYGFSRSGGSSHATSSFSGMLALVASKYPGDSREGLLSRLRAASPYNPTLGGGGKRTDTGWATPRINCALGGLCAISASGPSVVESAGYYTYTVSQLGSSVPVSISWDVPAGVTVNGSTTESSLSVYFEPGFEEEFYSFSATVTDQVSRLAYTDVKSVVVRMDGASCGTQVTC